MKQYGRDIIIERDASVAIIQKRRDGILEMHPKEGVKEGTLEQVKEIYKIFMEIQQGVKSPVYTDNRNTMNVTSEQKEFIKNTFPDFATASANHIESPVLRFMHTIFINLYKPKIPIKSFLKKEDAINWLKQYIQPEKEKELIQKYLD